MITYVVEKINGMPEIYIQKRDISRGTKFPVKNVRQAITDQPAHLRRLIKMRRLIRVNAFRYVGSQTSILSLDG